MATPPSGRKHRNSPVISPVVASHRRTVPSSEPVRIRVPSGLHCASVTPKRWPARDRTTLPETSSHTRTTPSSKPASTLVPSGLQA